MKNFICLTCIIIACLSVSGISVPNIAAVGANPDTEVVVTGSVEPASRLTIDFTVTNPNSSNTVLLVFGKDLNGDGELSIEEIKYQVGWDAGAWVEYSNGVDSIPLQSGVSNNRFAKRMPSGELDTVNLIVRGDVSGKVFAGKDPTLILLR